MEERGRKTAGSRKPDSRTYAFESPLIRQGEIAPLRVKALTDFGAFLDWGLEKDLFLPFKEQTYRPRVGETVVVGLYTDKTGRPCASMRLKRFVSEETDLVKDAKVEALVYEVREGTGVLVIADGKYFGLIPEQDWRGTACVGDRIEARVTRVRPGGKVDLSPRKKAYKQIDDDAEMLLEMMRDRGGALGFDEKADPETVRRQTGLTKAAFKRAVGRLLRDALVTEREGDIVLNR